jgi:hypothetical protein
LKKIENLEPPVLCWFFQNFENLELRFFDSDFKKTPEPDVINKIQEEPTPSKCTRS